MKYYGMIFDKNEEVEAIIATDDYSAEEVANERYVLDFEQHKDNIAAGKVLKVYDASMRLVAVL